MSQATLNLSTAPGYQVLATAGKKVLRPGGRAATEQLFEWANFQPGDTVLELASGLGTSAIALAKRYDINIVGLEKDPDHVAIAQARVQAARLQDRIQIIQGNIFQLESLPQQFDYVLAEAILTMQSLSGKRKILQGVCDRLKPTGQFLSHELIAVNHLDQIYQDLAQALRVNSTPLTKSDWNTMLQQASLTITHSKVGAMHLLELGQLLHDEGLPGTLKLIWNVLTHPLLRDRVFMMRRVFAQHRQDLKYIVLTAEKQPN